MNAERRQYHHGRLGDRWIPVALTVLAAVLRAHRVAAQSLWSDEDITLDRTRMALDAMLAGLPVEQAPLYFVSMTGWTRLAGSTDLALRWPSVLAGVVAVTLGVTVGRRLVGPTAGWLLGLLMAVSPFQVSYGQEARMYAFLQTAVLWSAAAVLRARWCVRGASLRRTAWWMLAGVAAAGAVYTHYYGVLWVAVLASWAVWDLRVASPARRRRVLADWAVAGASAATLFAPWIPRALRVFEHEGWREPVSLSAVPLQLMVAWSGQTVTTALRSASPAAWAAAGLMVALGGLGATVLVLRAAGGLYGWGDRPGADPATRGHAAAWLLLWAAVPTVLAALLLVRTPDYHPRYYFALLPAWQLLVATGAAALPGPATALAAVLIVVTAVGPLQGWYGDPADQKQDYRRMVTTVNKASHGRDTVLFLDGPSMGLTKRYLPEDAPLKLENLQSSTNRERTKEGLRLRMVELAERRPNVWLAEDGGSEDLADRWLTDHLYPVARVGIQDVTLARYYAPPAEVRRAMGLDEDGGADLRRSPDAGRPGRTPRRWHGQHPAEAVVAVTGAVSPTVGTGRVLPVRLRWLPGSSWDGSPAAARPHRVSVRLLPADAPPGTEPIASVDRAPVDWSRPTTTWSPDEGPVLDRHGILVPPDAATGPADVVVILYDETTLEPLGRWRFGPVDIVGRP